MRSPGGLGQGPWHTPSFNSFALRSGDEAVCGAGPVRLSSAEMTEPRPAGLLWKWGEDSANWGSTAGSRYLGICSFNRCIKDLPPRWARICDM